MVQTSITRSCWYKQTRFYDITKKTKLRLRYDEEANRIIMVTIAVPMLTLVVKAMTMLRSHGVKLFLLLQDLHFRARESLCSDMVDSNLDASAKRDARGTVVTRRGVLATNGRRRRAQVRSSVVGRTWNARFRVLVAEQLRLSSRQNVDTPTYLYPFTIWRFRVHRSIVYDSRVIVRHPKRLRWIV